MIKIPKLGLVKIRGYRNLEELTDRIINITIEKEKTNKYYVSVITGKEEDAPKKINTNKYSWNRSWNKGLSSNK